MPLIMNKDTLKLSCIMKIDQPVYIYLKVKLVVSNSHSS